MTTTSLMPLLLESREMWGTVAGNHRVESLQLRAVRTNTLDQAACSSHLVTANTEDASAPSARSAARAESLQVVRFLVPAVAFPLMRTNRVDTLEAAAVRGAAAGTIRGWAERVAAGFPPVGPTVADHLVSRLNLEDDCQQLDGMRNVRAIEAA